MLINNFSFLRWDDGTIPPTTPKEPATGYQRDKSRCDYMPLLINGEPLNFYINTTEGLNDLITNPTTVRLELVNAQTQQVINSNVATLLQDFFVTEDGNNVYTFYSSVSISTTAPGIYFLRIADNTTNFLDSNNLVVPNDDFSLYSCLCKFRHDRYFYGVNYQNLPDFYQQFRLHFNEIDKQYEQDKDVYNEVTTGKQRTYNDYKKKVRTFETYYFDDFAHDAAEIMFDSELFYANGKRYVIKGTYKVLTQPLSKVKKGQADCYDEDFATANRCLLPIQMQPGCNGIQEPTYDLPNGAYGQPYGYSITLVGDQPFQISNVTKPAWMNIGISANILSFTGIPNAYGSAIAVSLTVSNCNDLGSINIADTINVPSGGGGGNIQANLTLFGNTLTCCVQNGTPPFNIHFFGVASGSDCATFTIDNPDQVISDVDHCVSTNITFGAFSGSHYTFKASINVDELVTNPVNLNPCLTPDSLILMKDGSEKMLAAIEEGDELFDSIVTSRQDFKVDRIFIINRTLKCSQNHVHILHPYALVTADYLDIGYFLIDKQGNPVEIKTIEEIVSEFDVINISTDTETYIANGIRTHNKLKC